jgi:membrane protease YdiL (CAAX protease family)
MEMLMSFTSASITVFVLYLLALPLGIGVCLERLPLARALFRRGEDRAFWAYWAVALGVIWLSAVAVLVACAVDGVALASLGLPAVSGWLVASAVATVGVATAVTVARGRRVGALRRTPGPVALMPHTTTERAFGIVAISVTGAIAEEIVYRGFLMALFTPVLGLAGAIVLQALLFAFHHGGTAQSPAFFAVRAGIGVLLAVLAVNTSGLLWPMAVHFALDVFGYGLFPEKAILGATRPAVSAPAP